MNFSTQPPPEGECLAYSSDSSMLGRVISRPRLENVRLQIAVEAFNVPQWPRAAVATAFLGAWSFSYVIGETGHT